MAAKRGAAQKRPAPSTAPAPHGGPLSPLVAAIAVAALAALTYAPTLGHGFVWDDPISVQRWLPALPTWRAAFFPPANIPQFPADYYRPLQLLSYRLDRAIGGGEPWAFHLDVVLLHVLATVLVFRAGMFFLDRRSSSPWAAACAAALFAVHPIHSESVAWMAARPDVMVTCAGLAGLLAYWHRAWSPWLRASVAASFVLIALLCKENAAALLIVIPASVIILRSRQESASAVRDGNTVTAVSVVPFIVAAVIYLVLRSAGIGAGVVPQAVMPPNPVSAFVGALGTYLRLLVFPYPQSAYITDLWSTGPSLVASLLVVGGFAGLMWWSWQRGERALLFSLFWIAITLAPSLAAVAKAAIAPLSERYLYLPSVGFCWAVGVLLAHAAQRQRTMTQVGVAALLALACWATVQRNQIWRDNQSLWSDTAAKNLVEGLPLRSLAAVTLERGDGATAERLFHQALERNNDAHGQYIIHNNLGTIALNRGDDVAAEAFYRKALAFESTADCQFNLGLIELQRSTNPALATDARAEKLREARALFEQALAASPYDPDIHIGLAQAVQAMGDTTTARRHLEKALSLGVPATTAARVRRLLKEITSAPNPQAGEHPRTPATASAPRPPN